MLSWGRGHVRDGRIALQNGMHAMFDFLKSMIGKRGMPLTEAESSIGKEIAVDLGRLAAISPDLAQRTIVYVLTGENGSVLLQLEQQAKSVQAALSQFQPTVLSAADKAAVQAAIKARNDVLSRAHGPSATYTRRYLEVLTLPLKGTR
jgi:hypothetical protein